MRVITIDGTRGLRGLAESAALSAVSKAPYRVEGAAALVAPARSEAEAQQLADALESWARTLQRDTGWSIQVDEVIFGPQGVKSRVVFSGRGTKELAKVKFRALASRGWGYYFERLSVARIAQAPAQGRGATFYVSGAVERAKAALTRPGRPLYAQPWVQALALGTGIAALVIAVKRRRG